MKRIRAIETVNKLNQEVKLAGWVNTLRNMGKIVFIDLRDRSGLVQVVFVPQDLDKESLEAVKKIRPEFVVEVVGQIRSRPQNQINQDLPTGTVEVAAKKLAILSESKTPPFTIDNEIVRANEDLRLKYRYLDLRHERMKNNLILRHRVIKFIRDWLDQRGFLEIETPVLTKGTPEGAREFIVPSRLYPGKFYVLPQSPQQFKQLCMVAGLERYFQIARCFRDEDTRGDRQPEFTQLDLEMSFVETENILNLTEELFIALVKTITPNKKILQIPFPRISYQESMEKYKSDKPDLRKDKNDPNLLAFCWIIDFPFFKKTDDGGWTFTHNPFSAPKPEHMPHLMAKKNIDEILTTQYDIVLNGCEIGGGSIRNHNPEALRKVFEIMGLKKEQIEMQFGHILEAFSYGVPPHGGIAPGIDRLVMILANEPNIREVIPFPKTADANDLMMGAPSELPKEQTKETNIKIIRENS